MKTEKVLLSQMKVNADNPRKITDRKLDLLVERLLAFPKMIEIRPVVVDSKMKALGGNMRVKAFNRIAGMTIDQIKAILSKTKNYQRLTAAEKKNLLEHWRAWLEKPTVEIVKASTLSEAEKKEFIIADNASFGEWDTDALAKWDAEDLASWGLDDWAPERPWDGGAQQPAQQPQAPEPQQPFDGTNLPPELQGVDINPDDLPKIEGDNQVAMERIIIVYPKDRAGELASLIGLEKIEKVVYNIDEINAVK